MSWEQHAQKYDGDTRRLLEIAVVFLERFFGHDAESADRLMGEFLAAHSQHYSEDDLHYFSSYGVAALAHYLIALKGTRETLGKWLVESGHNDTPYEALEYFRENYFDA